MRIEGPAKRLRVYVGEADRWEGQPLSHAIVVKAREMGLAGATVARGLGGYGAHHRIHDAHLIEVEGNLPEVVEIVDAAKRIDDFIPVLDRMVREGMATVDDVEVIHYRHSAEEAP